MEIVMANDTTNTESGSPAVPKEPRLDPLSFTSRREGDGINLWSPAEVAEDWAAQCRAGREHGCAAVDYIRSTNDAAMLPGIVRTIAERGTFGGVEVGFFAALSMILAQTA
jgi:hypothetical protein